MYAQVYARVYVHPVALEREEARRERASEEAHAHAAHNTARGGTEQIDDHGEVSSASRTVGAMLGAHAFPRAGRSAAVFHRAEPIPPSVLSAVPAFFHCVGAAVNFAALILFWGDERRKWWRTDASFRIRTPAKARR